MSRGTDDPEAHYYPDPTGRYPIGPDDALSYARLVKHVQQAGEHAMIHAHAEDADVWCMDHDCEVWGGQDDEHARPTPLPRGVTDAEHFARWRTVNSGTEADYLAQQGGCQCGHLPSEHADTAEAPCLRCDCGTLHYLCEHGGEEVGDQ